MRILIVEDDVCSRFLLCDILAPYGVCHVAVDGIEAVKAAENAIANGTPYDLICLDIKMPNKNGHEALNEIRDIESQHGIMLGDGAKVIMTTSMSDSSSIMNAFNSSCEAYLVKPIDEQKLLDQLITLGLLNEE